MHSQSGELPARKRRKIATPAGNLSSEESGDEYLGRDLDNPDAEFASGTGSRSGSRSGSDSDSDSDSDSNSDSELEPEVVHDSRQSENGDGDYVDADNRPFDDDISETMPVGTEHLPTEVVAVEDSSADHLIVSLLAAWDE